MSKKRNRIELRVTDKTRNILHEQSSEKQQTNKPNYSEYVRDLIHRDNGDFSHSKNEELEVLNSQIARIGNNLNQLTRYYHSGRFSATTETKIAQCIEDNKEVINDVKLLISEREN
ncbi:MAG: plasmid mobilization relaxosome protein MobC [Suipraeoptans sp.]